MKHYALGLILIFGLMGIPSEAATTYFPPLQPLEQSGDFIQENTIGALPAEDNQSDAFVANYSAINRIEQALFGRIYTGQNISLRLSRIERSLFTITYPNSSYTQRIDNIISNFNQMNRYPNISTNGLSRMETRVFNQSFSQNNIQRRVERLEEQIFGAVQSGDIDERYKALQLASRNYNKNIGRNYIPNTVASTGWKGILGNLGGTMLGGTMTGFTPPINPYYGSQYNNSNPYTSGYGIYKGYGVNRGLGGYSCGDAFSNFGSGMGATILD